VVPLIITDDFQETIRKIDSLNGVIFPGGTCIRESCQLFV